MPASSKASIPGEIATSSLSFSGKITPPITPKHYHRINIRNEKEAQRVSFGAGYPADVHADIPADVRGQKLRSGPRNPGKKAFRCGHPWPEGADVHDPRGVKKTLVRKTSGWIFVPYNRRNRCHLHAFSYHVFLYRIQQTVSGNKPSQYPPDTIRWTLFRCSLRGQTVSSGALWGGKPRLENPVWRPSPANSPDTCWRLFRYTWSYGGFSPWNDLCNPRGPSGMCEFPPRMLCGTGSTWDLKRSLPLDLFRRGGGDLAMWE